LGWGADVVPVKVVPHVVELLARGLKGLKYGEGLIHRFRENLGLLNVEPRSGQAAKEANQADSARDDWIAHGETLIHTARTGCWLVTCHRVPSKTSRTTWFMY
jgi:hypothetical protein